MTSDQETAPVKRISEQTDDRLYETIDGLEERGETNPEDAMEMRRCVRDSEYEKLQTMLILQITVNRQERDPTLFDPKAVLFGFACTALVFLVTVVVTGGF